MEFWERLSEAWAQSEVEMAWPPHQLAFLAEMAHQAWRKRGRARGRPVGSDSWGLIDSHS